MYISLDTADIQIAPKDGRERILQMDHRTPDEIAERPGLSSVIGLIRCLNPRRAYPDLDLFYNCAHEPPAFLRDVLAACGARLWVGQDVGILSQPLPALAVDDRAVESPANSAMAALAVEAVADLPEKDPYRALDRKSTRLNSSH